MIIKFLPSPVFSDFKTHYEKCTGEPKSSDRNVPCPICKVVFQNYREMESHKIKNHSKPDSDKAEDKKDDDHD